MRPSRLLHHLPIHLLNGLAVGLGLGLVQAVVGAAAGHGAALAAISGAVFASLADQPLTPGRQARRVLTAGLVGLAATVLVSVLRWHPIGLGFGIALLSFAASLALAWGPRAGPISFVPVLALVFTMAGPVAADLREVARHAGWSALGAALFLAWSVASAAVLQRRYRTLALAAVMEGTARLLRARSRLLVDGATPAALLQAWIGEEAALAQHVQVARDLLFAASLRRPAARRQVQLLLLAIDLRDTLLASELDLSLLDDGPAAEGRIPRAALAGNLNTLADEIDAVARALRFDEPLQAGDGGAAALQRIADQAALPVARAQAPLVHALLERARHMVDDVARMKQAMRSDAPPELPLTGAELQLFVSMEGWPLAALKPHLGLRSAVARHAVRMGIALGSAYFLALALPWAAHPHWLVLSVAVVLRGSLEQTLARRNGRVIGTVLGCLIVLGVALLHGDRYAGLLFLVAAGTAHAYLAVRYLVTAAAATVMALLQAHLADPTAGFAVVERLADTVLGALLAWGFSFLLPSWERRGLPRTVARVRAALARLTQEVLRFPGDAKAELALRLARREAYDALGNLAAMAQRTSVEPQHVRLPLQTLAELVTHSQHLLAQLAAVRLLLLRRADRLDRPIAAAELQAVAARMQLALLDAAVTGAGEGGGRSEGPQAGDEVPAPDVSLPLDLPQQDMMPWLRRRLRITEQAALRVRAAAKALHPRLAA